MFWPRVGSTPGAASFHYPTRYIITTYEAFSTGQIDNLARPVKVIFSAPSGENRKISGETHRGRPPEVQENKRLEDRLRTKGKMLSMHEVGSSAPVRQPEISYRLMLN